MQEGEEVLGGLGDGNSNVSIINNLHVCNKLYLGLGKRGFLSTLESVLDIAGGAGRAIGELYVIGYLEGKGAAVV